MHKQSNTSKILLASAVAGILAAGPFTGTAANAAEDGKVKCYGVNACKGQGACGGKGHSCAGTNACKGQGFIEISEDECVEKGGRLTEKKE